MFTAIYSILRPFLLFSLLLITTLFLSRVGLSLWQVDRFNDFSSVTSLFFNGLRIDLSTLGYLLILPAILHPWLIKSKFSEAWQKILSVLFFVIFIAVIFFELSTPAFINEYGFRPNRLFIEYLAYPDEVMQMLVNGHLLTIVLVFSCVCVFSYVVRKVLNKYIFSLKTS